jgi:hypothetical protein
LAAASLSQNGGASQEGKQAENYRVLHISSPFDLKAGRGLGENECADLENARLAESCKIFLAVNISWRKGMEFSLQFRGFLSTKSGHARLVHQYCTNLALFDLAQPEG